MTGSWKEGKTRLQNEELTETYDDESLVLSWADEDRPKIKDAAVDPATATRAGWV